MFDFSFCIWWTGHSCSFHDSHGWWNINSGRGLPDLLFPVISQQLLLVRSRLIRDSVCTTICTYCGRWQKGNISPRRNECIHRITNSLTFYYMLQHTCYLSYEMLKIQFSSLLYCFDAVKRQDRKTRRALLFWREISPSCFENIARPLQKIEKKLFYVNDMSVLENVVP